jgi:hypothetical protein
MSDDVQFARVREGGSMMKQSSQAAQQPPALFIT